MSLGLGIASTFPFEGVSTDIDTATSGTAAGLQLWLKNDTDVTAEQWKDQSGNDNHAEQDTEGNQATVSGGGLDFERGESDHYDLQSAITIAVNGGFCLAVVLETESASGGTILSKDASDQFRIVDADTLRFKADTTDTTTNFKVSSAFPNGSKMLLLLNRSAGASNRFTLMKNGVTLTPDTDTSTNEAEGENPHGFDLNVLGSLSGSSDYFDGKIYELAFWDRSLTSQEITDVNSVLKSRHGL
jgi:hypothetical protein